MYQRHQSSTVTLVNVHGMVERCPGHASHLDAEGEVGFQEVEGDAGDDFIR